MFNLITTREFRGSPRGAGRVATAAILTALVLPALVLGGDLLPLNAAGGGRPADALIVDYQLGGELPATVTANLVSNRGAVPFLVTVESSGWLSVSPSKGMTPAEITISINPLGLSVGSYSGSVTVSTSVLQDGKILDAQDVSPITLRVATGATPAVTAIVNPADFGTGGATAAGGWVVIQGKNLAAAAVEADGQAYPAELGGTKVMLGERALPLMKVSPVEIYAFVPYDTPTNTVLPLVVTRGQASALPRDLAVSVQMPALFLRDPNSGSRDGRVVVGRGDVYFDLTATNSVRAGDILYIDAVGLGAVDKDVSPSKVAPNFPYARVSGISRVTVGGVDAFVWYLGLVPGTVGVYQVRIEVPAGVTPGNDVPIVVTIGGQASAAVTVAME